MQKRAMHNHYFLDDNGLVIVILNIHSKLRHASVKYWDAPKKCYLPKRDVGFIQTDQEQ